jgi:hypothetical protein
VPGVAVVFLVRGGRWLLGGGGHLGVIVVGFSHVLVSPHGNRSLKISGITDVVRNHVPTASIMWAPDCLTPPPPATP